MEFTIRIFRDFNDGRKHTHIQRCLFHFNDAKKHSEIILGGNRKKFRVTSNVVYIARDWIRN